MTRTTKHENDCVDRFESIAEFLSTIEKDSLYLNETSPSPWFNGESAAQSVGFARTGNDALVAKAESIIDQLSDVSEGNPIFEWTPTISGAYPVVPEYLAGRPDCMRSLAPSENVSPVSIYVNTCSSAGISAEQYQNRGAAILALLIKLQRTRPVDLFVCFDCDGRMSGKSRGQATLIIPIESRPLSLAHAAYLLSSTGFSRHLMYGYLQQRMGSTLFWPPYFNLGTNTVTNKQKAANLYNLQESDLLIAPFGLHDRLLDEPVRWVNEQLERYNSLTMNA